MNAIISPTPLNKIALSCSGGGYRAASFHLGAMSYLNRLRFESVPLLEKVVMISTVSGGTITGVVYALKKQEGWAFEAIYAFLLDRLKSVDLVKEGIEMLNPGVSWANGFKRKNLINAFAEIYDRELTKGATFSVFDTMKSHLEAVAFNSTEFNNGINFRFRNRGTGFFGNRFIRVRRAVAGEVRLADAIAASSCFPGGFEPMIWPGDFQHDTSPALHRLSANGAVTGLMDGGIYDNQGIDSILTYVKKAGETYFDLVIISDVTSPYINAYEPVADKTAKGWRALTLSDLNARAKKIWNGINIGVLITVLLLALLPAAKGYPNTLWSGLSLGSAIVLTLLLALLRIGKRSVTSTVKDQWRKITTKPMLAFYVEKLSLLHIEKIPFVRLEALLMDRLNSLVTMIGNIFLKVIRKLNYDKLYEDDQYFYRRITNRIRELTESDFLQNRSRPAGSALIPAGKSILTGNYEEVIGPKLKAVAEEAASFGTTLWFTEDQQLPTMLDKLVATGQASMCYNMLTYLEPQLFVPGNGFDKLPIEKQQALYQLYDQCKTDWTLFKADPFFLVNQPATSSAPVATAPVPNN